jgi:Tol biopolymer transport system component
MILSLGLTACAAVTAPKSAAVIPESTPIRITAESSPTEFTPTATTTHTPSPTSTPMPTPFGAHFTRTPGPIPTMTPYVTSPPLPTPDAIGTPGFEWEGPAIVYQAADLTLSSSDASQKNVFASVPRLEPWNSDFSPEAGRIVYESHKSLWILDLGKGAENIFSSDQYIESPAISRDGARIAYSLVHGFGNEDLQQLWMINPDGSENTLVIDNTRQYITDPGPFRLVSSAWSLDNTRLYMVTTTDSEATPVGMYVADLSAGTIEKALTPQVTLWDLAFSPDGTRIAYRTFQWVPSQDGPPVAGPPFTLQVTDLGKGDTSVLQESDTFEYYHPVWSPDGSRIAYTVRSRQLGGEVGLFIIDLATRAALRLVPGSEGSQTRPRAWLEADRLAYMEVIPSSEDTSNYTVSLYTIKIDGSEKHVIDFAIYVLGVLDN